MKKKANSMNFPTECILRVINQRHFPNSTNSIYMK